MLQCGSINDVYSYKKMKRRPSSSLQDDSPPSSPPPPPPPTSLAKPRHEKSMSFSISAPVSPTSAKLDAKKTMSFRWIGRQSAAGTSSSSDKRASSGDVKASTKAPSSTASSAAGLPPKKQKRIGFIDILLGYHSLLQATPAYPASAQRRELYPTIGFIRNPDYGAQP
ncbi:hypothetical protein L7F22_029135 [Adiantum nelumboides]|nr:hypothetical protein [Adiantum nelumboides]